MLIIIIALCSLGALISAAQRYKHRCDMERHCAKYENAMTTAALWDASDDSDLASEWRIQGDHHFDAMLQSRASAEMMDTALVLNLGAAVAVIIFEILKGTI